MLIAGGPKYLLLSALLYAPATVLFVMARREQNQALMTRLEAAIFGCIAIAAAAGLCAVVTGAITI